MFLVAKRWLKIIMPSGLLAAAARWRDNAVRRIRRTRVGLAARVLPSEYYVQSIPKLAKLGRFPLFTAHATEYDAAHERVGVKNPRDGNRVALITFMADLASTLPDGDYAELGTWRGFSARIIFDYLPKEASLHCFDTFEGFDERDTKEESDVTGVSAKPSEFSDTSLDLVRSYITAAPDSPALELHRGWFPDTFSGLEDKDWRFVNLDADLYAPMAAGIETFYPKLVPGGVMLMHDYGSAYTGVKKAADEYFLPLGITPILFNDNTGSAVVIKPRLPQPSPERP
jgi:hypothetical protein